MDTKYYTPEIEEINVGFEYEWRERNTNDIWTPSKYSIGFDLFDCGSGEVPASYVFNNMNDVENPIEIRVKYLDQQDIEELGWKLIVWHKNSGFFSYDKYTLEYSDNSIDNTILKNSLHITQNDEGSNIVLFQGYIKNKSELKKLMKQLNITINNKTNG